MIITEIRWMIHSSGPANKKLAMTLSYVLEVLTGNRLVIKKKTQLLLTYSAEKSH